MRLLVVGAGGHGKVVLSTALEAGWQVVGVLDDDPQKWEQMVLGIPVLGPTSLLVEHKDVVGVLGIGDNRARKKLAEDLKGVRWATLIHPRAYAHLEAKLGLGSVVFAGSVIQPSAKIGSHVIINTGAIVEHDCVLGDYVHVGPGARLAGNVCLGEGAFLGVGTSVIPGIKIGSWSVVGAGSVVTKDIPSQAVAYGVPARVHRFLSLPRIP